jgi:hypothetical protein
MGLRFIDVSLDVRALLAGLTGPDARLDAPSGNA